jgi:hypothetical protein
MPFGHLILGYSIEHLGVDSNIHLEVHAGILRTRLILLLITGQLSSLVNETIVPYFTKHKTLKTLKEIAETSRPAYALKKWRKNRAPATPEIQTKEIPPLNEKSSQKESLWEIYSENSPKVPLYNTFEDFSEMVAQFGYISLFSIIWPLAPLTALINNFIELKSDLWKLCFHCRRPNPSRTEDIGPWLNFLQLLSWSSTITNMSLVVLFFNWSFIPTPLWVDLIFIIIFEHLYFLVRHTLKATLCAPSEDTTEQIENEEFEYRNDMTKELKLLKTD